MPYKDKSGMWIFYEKEKIHEWTVLSNDRKRIGNNSYVRCQCSCGTIEWVRADKLVAGKTKMCKKNRLYHSTMREKYEEKIGQRIGKLTIESIDDIEPDKHRRNKVYFKCRCDCGNTTIVCHSDLFRINPTISCGCEHEISFEDGIKKTGRELNTNLELAKKKAPNKSNKLKERNIFKKDNLYVVAINFRKERVFYKYFKTLKEAITARDEFREGPLAEMMAEAKEKIKNEK